MERRMIQDQLFGPGTELGPSAYVRLKWKRLHTGKNPCGGSKGGRQVSGLRDLVCCLLLFVEISL